MVLTIILIQVLSLALGQSDCYQIIDNYSGVTISDDNLQNLNHKACTLIDKLPTQLQDSFKVYEFSFYINNIKMEEGLDSIMKKILNNQNDFKKYYLVFGEFVSDNGVSYKVDFKLPYNNYFFCLNQSDRIWIDEKVKLFDYSEKNEYKNKIIDYFKSIFVDLNQCCDYTEFNTCGLNISHNEIDEILVSHGFIPIPIDSTYTLPISTLKNNEFSSKKISGNQINDNCLNCNNILVLDGNEFNISANIFKYFNKITNLENSYRVEITNNDLFYVNMDFTTHYDNYIEDNSDFKYWFHLDDVNNYIYIHDDSRINLEWFDLEYDTLRPEESESVKFPCNITDNVYVEVDLNRPEYPNFFKRMTNYFFGDYHLTRALQFQYNHSIPNEDVYYYSLNTDPRTGKESPAPLEFILIKHHYYDYPGTPIRYEHYKHLFRAKKYGTYWIHTSHNDDVFLDWTNLYDDTGAPILNSTDTDELEPRPIELDIPIFGYNKVVSKKILKNARRRLIIEAKKLAKAYDDNGVKHYKIYRFLTDAGLYYGQTKQFLYQRIGDHARGKEIVEGTLKVIAGYPTTIHDGKLITDGLEQVVIEYGKLSNLANKRNVISKLRRPDYFNNAINEAETFLKTYNNETKDLYLELKPIFDQL